MVLATAHQVLDASHAPTLPAAAEAPEQLAAEAETLAASSGGRRRTHRGAGGGGHRWLDTGRPNAVCREDGYVTTTPEPSEARRKHLEFLQAVINRQAGNSFLLKGWSLTVAGLIYGYAAKQNAWQVAAAGVAVFAAFWWLDAFYLRQERLFRCLYDRARVPASPVELFSMDTRPYQVEARVAWPQVLFSPALRVLYGTGVAVGVALAVVTAGWHNTKPRCVAAPGNPWVASGPSLRPGVGQADMVPDAVHDVCRDANGLRPVEGPEITQDVARPPGDEVQVQV
jgi:hypothetical protein